MPRVEPALLDEAHEIVDRRRGVHEVLAKIRHQVRRARRRRRRSGIEGRQRVHAPAQEGPSRPARNQGIGEVLVAQEVGELGMHQHVARRPAVALDEAVDRLDRVTRQGELLAPMAPVDLGQILVAQRAEGTRQDCQERVQHGAVERPLSKAPELLLILEPESKELAEARLQARQVLGAQALRAARGFDQVLGIQPHDPGITAAEPRHLGGDLLAIGAREPGIHAAQHVGDASHVQRLDRDGLGGRLAAFPAQLAEPSLRARRTRALSRGHDDAQPGVRQFRQQRRGQAPAGRLVEAVDDEQHRLCAAAQSAKQVGG